MNFELKQITSALVREGMFTEMRRYFLRWKQYCRHNIWVLKISLQKTQWANQEGEEVHVVTYAGVCSGLIVADKPETGKIEILMTFFTKLNILIFIWGNPIFLAVVTWLRQDGLLAAILRIVATAAASEIHFLPQCSGVSWIAVPEVLRGFEQHVPCQNRTFLGK